MSSSNKDMTQTFSWFGWTVTSDDLVLYNKFMGFPTQQSDQDILHSLVQFCPKSITACRQIGVRYRNGQKVVTYAFGCETSPSCRLSTGLKRFVNQTFKKVFGVDARELSYPLRSIEVLHERGKGFYRKEQFGGQVETPAHF
jgi:hypothetical protein